MGHSYHKIDFWQRATHKKHVLPGQLLTLTIKDLARSGSGVARAEDGCVIFVPFTTPGDIVEARLESIEKRYAFATLEKILTPSAARSTPPCPVFTQCGGCEWQHLPYAMQWKTKRDGLMHALGRVQVEFKGMPEELPAEEIWNYRNRIQLRGFRKDLGFYARGSKDLVPIEECFIARKEINAVLPSVRQRGHDLLRPYKVELAVGDDGQVVEAWNQGHAATGFKQVHDEQNEKLQSWVAARIPNGAIVWDLFGGRGNLSLGLAERVKEIHCVDIGANDGAPVGSPDNFFSYRKSVADWLLNPPVERADIAILDPPREGLGVERPQILDALMKAQAKYLLFIGCDVDAWAQDLSRTLRRKHWKLSQIAALDLFPQTHHVEALALLEQI